MTARERGRERETDREGGRERERGRRMAEGVKLRKTYLEKEREMYHETKEGLIDIDTQISSGCCRLE